MKTYCLTLTILILASACPEITAKILNGYAPEINGARRSLEYLENLLQQRQLGFHERKTLKLRIRTLKNFITGYEYTEKQLRQFRLVAPAISNNIDALKDFIGRPVDVYVKFASRDAMKNEIMGLTQIDRLDDDRHCTSSEYGINTVSIVVRHGHTSLLTLAHEFGHVQYEVPNLAHYAEIYQKRYVDVNFASNSIGHETGDPSGRNATAFERQFIEQRMRFLKNQGNKDSGI